MSKKMTPEVFAQIKAMQKDKVPPKWISKATGFHTSTITTAFKFDTKEAMDQYHRDRLAGYKKPKQQKQTSIEDEAIAEINKADGYTKAIEDIIISQEQLLKSQKATMEMLEFIHADLVRVIKENKTKKGWIK